MSLVKRNVLSMVSIVFLFMAAIVLSGCARRAVIVTSTHWLGMASLERTTLLGSPNKGKDRDALCHTYLKKILASTSLNQGQQQKIYSYACSDKDYVSEFYNFYYSLPDDQRIELDKAFAHYGYYVQGYGCFNSYG
ncbi:hypothetical protein [Dissulfurimicrobium hydrothermale]|uniref:hypothetical protein n=1 Tax=Dissulfurimicrobium hydrothermale TaxID=1750598 RepID=UPI001EDB06A7|nr:hypothetical protein [Dissulfurimicrobium hydrothermale]UKL13302.1 hypothetical protein LGS26_07385 [Dissulfurimicrobium hydrothermale]